MSHPGDHADLSAPALPAPGPATTMTAPDPGTAAPSLPAPGTPTHTLDGDAPRLGSATTTVAPAAPVDVPESPSSPEIPAGLDLPSLPSLPTAAPVLTSATGLPSPDDAPQLAATPTVAPSPTHDETATTTDTAEPSETADEPAHPMAHLMPEKAAPSEASMKAAAIRAAKKKKAKKIKLGVGAGFLVVAVVVGPPLWSWLTNAVNESGGVTTEEPAD